MYIVKEPYIISIRPYNSFNYVILINHRNMHHGYLFYIEDIDKIRSNTFETIIYYSLYKYIEDDIESLWYLIKKHDTIHVTIGVDTISTDIVDGGVCL